MRRTNRRLLLPKPTLYTFGEGELSDLDHRTAHILRMRSGMWDGGHHKLREVGDELGISAERARQVQSQGLLLIRQVREAQRHLRDESTTRRSGRRW